MSEHKSWCQRATVSSWLPHMPSQKRGGSPTRGARGQLWRRLRRLTLYPALLTAERDLAGVRTCFPGGAFSSWASARGMWWARAVAAATTSPLLEGAGGGGGRQRPLETSPPTEAPVGLCRHAPQALHVAQGPIAPHLVPFSPPSRPPLPQLHPS